MPNCKIKKDILVAVDFSAHSEAALNYAASLAQCLNTKLTVLHVIHDHADSPGYYAEKKNKGEKKRLKRMEEVAEGMMEQFIIKSIAKNSTNKMVLKKADLILVSGLTVTKILQVIEKKSPSMLIVGKKGRSGLKDILMGSKAEQLIKLCDIPVVIIKK